MRRALTAGIIGVVVASASVAGAAPRSSIDLYFATNCGATATYFLTTSSGDAPDCTSADVVASKGSNAPGDFTLAKPLHGRIDATGRVTGRIYVVNEPPVRSGSGAEGAVPPGTTLPGYVDVQFAIVVNGIRLGAFEMTGMTPALGALSQAFSYPVPGRLSGKPIASVKVAVSWITTGGLGMCVGTYGDFHSSMHIPSS